MKKPFLLIIFLIASITGFSQHNQKTLGIIVAPNYNHFQENLYFEPGFSVSPGIFYDHLFTKRLGMNTGLQLYFQSYAEDRRKCRHCPEGLEEIKVRYTNIELPVNLSFCLNPEAENGVKTFLFSGITLNRAFSTKYTSYYTDRVVKSRFNNFSEDNWNHFLRSCYMNLGFELRKNIGTHYAGAIGVSAKFSSLNSFDFSSEYQDTIILNLNLKFGRNL